MIKSQVKFRLPYLVTSKIKQERTRRWDSERELFYDDIAHVLQNTKRELTLFIKLNDS